MIIKPSEKGQALILITLAAIGLFAFAALAIDSSRAYSDKRHAQNAADTAALAGALAFARGNDIQQAALDRAATNGYQNVTGDPSTVVTVTVANVPEEDYCPGDATGKDITVTIESYLNTTFAKIIGRSTMASGATAVARSCGFVLAPMFNGNAIVGLKPHDGGPCAIDTGNSNSKHWTTRGGGVFANGCVTHENGKLTIPGTECVVAVGDIDTNNGHGTINTVENPVNYSNGCAQENMGGTVAYDREDVEALMPPDPCTGTITAGRYAGGGKVPSSAQLEDDPAVFENDIFCITDFGALDDKHVTLNNATLYVTDLDFDLRYNGGGTSGFYGTATGAGDYQGYYMIIKYIDNKTIADTCQQYFDFRGNGALELQGTILAPTTCVDYRGNSTGTGKLRSQMIFYRFTGNGGSTIDVTYNADDNHLIPFSPSISILE